MIKNNTAHALHPIPLRYGCNPHQTPAMAWINKQNPPFKVLHGAPGYINLLDALNAWQLVREAGQVLHLPAAASFKHVSPAGVALGLPLQPQQRQALGLQGVELSAVASAYARARGGDPMCSYGDFAAVSTRVDVSLARLLKREVCDGIIAPDYEEEALVILRSKKQGRFVILCANPQYTPAAVEEREVYGVRFSQQRNNARIDARLLHHRVTQNKTLTPQQEQDLILAAITVKYTQSNSVAYAWGGQVIGIGAGQQSRVDCTRLAGQKAEMWHLRHHPQVLALPFTSHTRRVDRINAVQSYLLGFVTAQERAYWGKFFTNTPPQPLDKAQRGQWLQNMQTVALASDAFFPFRDNIDQAALRGVGCIVQPGGSAGDASVIAACDDYAIVMAFSNLRLFHH